MRAAAYTGSTGQHRNSREARSLRPRCRLRLRIIEEQPLTFICVPLFGAWTFLIAQQGVRIGRIRKRWAGLAKEAFTDADDFGVELSPTLTDGRLRQLILAATLLLDLVFFENRRGSE